MKMTIDGKMVAIAAVLLIALAGVFTAQLVAGSTDAEKSGSTASTDAGAISCNGFSKVNVGGSMQAGAYTVKLSDIAQETGSNKAHNAILEVLNANGVVLEKMQVMPGTAYVYSGPSGRIAVSVCQTAPGYTLNAKWAKMKAVPTNSSATTPCPGFSTIEIGGMLSVGGISVSLDDIAVSTGAQNAHPAILKVTQTNNGFVQKLSMLPGASLTVLTANNSKYLISVCQTAPGYTMNAKWAKIKAIPTGNPVSPDSCPANINITGATYGGSPEIGQSVDNPVFKARLSDISVGAGAQNSHPAVLDILDSNDNLLDSAVVEPGTLYAYNGMNGSIYKVFVCQTAPGMTLNAKWARIVTGVN